MKAKHDHAVETLAGTFRHPIYSPKGGIEGALLHAGESALQLVFEPHGGPASEAFADLKPGVAVAVEVRTEPPSDKGGAGHPVYRFERLVSVSGQAPAAAARASIRGTVVRLNFARHGEANGVVLDSGDFIHTKPDGMARLQLAVGDRVEAEGEAHPLADGGGQVIEARVVNGQPIGKAPKPRH